MFSDAQVNAIVNMVLENNLIRLREIQERTIEDNGISTIDGILQHNHMRMKQVYRVPFERKSES